MRTAILCGGKGTRLGTLGETTPKPLLPVGGRPLVWHIMEIYGSYGFSDFVLCLGHLKGRFEDYFASAADELGDWRVDLADTGPDTPTGGRLLKVADRLRNGDFFATYGDGVADVDVRRLLEFHQSHGRIATLVSVRPRLGFGLVEFGEGGRVTGFDEKPLLEGWVNGGFFVFKPGIFDYLEEDSVLEREPFERLAADGELMAYPHQGFWSCMDTYKDNLELNEIWASGRAPWKVESG
jgi:glucose-1-phosphate cytidylyltransferase